MDSAGRVLDFGVVRFLHPEDHVFTQPAVELKPGIWHHPGPGTAGDPVLRVHERVPMAMDARPRGRVLRGSSQREAPRPVHHSELPGSALRAFCAYAASPEYGWDRVCEQYFGTHPSQVCFDWNKPRSIRRLLSGARSRSGTTGLL